MPGAPFGRPDVLPQNNGRRPRILFVAEAVTLAHVARVQALTQLLDPAAFEIAVARDPRYAHVVPDDPGLVRFDIQSIPEGRFAAAMRSGRPIYDASTLRRYVDDDQRLMSNWKPDVVVGDFRLSLNVSARVAGIPYVNVVNAGWSPYAKARFTVPDGTLASRLGPGVAQRLFDLARPLVFAAHARPLNAVRRQFGLAPLAGGIRTTYTDADAVLYADLPELFETTQLPPHHAFLGPVQWAPSIALPPWWASLPRDRPIVYLTLGSSGQASLLPRIVDGLASLPLTIIAATAGRVELDRGHANLFVADYLPGDLASAAADVVVCNGGSPTCYQAITAGVPVLGIPSNLDQFLNMNAFEAAGAGIVLRSRSVTPASLRDRIGRLLNTPSFGAAAARLQAGVRASDPARVLRDTLHRLAAGEPR